MQITTKSKNGCLGSVFYLGIFLLAGLGLSYWGWNILQDARASASWPSVNGRVISSEVTHSTDSDGADSYSPEVTYTYTVEGTAHTNDLVKFGENAYGSRKKAEEVAGGYPVGREIKVYYDPAQPDRSVLEPGVSAGSFIVLGIGLLFILITLIAIPVTLVSRSRG